MQLIIVTPNLVGLRGRLRVIYDAHIYIYIYIYIGCLMPGTASITCCYDSNALYR